MLSPKGPMLPDQWPKPSPYGVGCALARAKEAPGVLLGGKVAAVSSLALSLTASLGNTSQLCWYVPAENPGSFFIPSLPYCQNWRLGWGTRDWLAGHKRQVTVFTVFGLGEERKRGGKAGLFHFFYLLPLTARDFVPWERSGSTWHSVLEGAERCRKAAGRARSEKDQFSGLCWVKD